MVPSFKTEIVCYTINLSAAIIIKILWKLLKNIIAMLCPSFLFLLANILVIANLVRSFHNLILWALLISPKAVNLSFMLFYDSSRFLILACITQCFIIRVSVVDILKSFTDQHFQFHVIDPGK